MNAKDILIGMNFVDDEYVNEAEKSYAVSRKRWITLVACICLICVTAFGWFSIYGPSLDDIDDIDDIPGNIGSSFVGQDEQPAQRPLQCNSYKELAKIVKEESKKNDSTYRDFREIAKLTVNQGLVVPYLNGNPLALISKFEEGTTITLFKSDWLNRPGIYMHYEPNGKYGLILVTMLNQEEICMTQEMRFSEFLREIAPDAPNIGNIKEGYTNIYEKEIELAGGPVMALVLETESERYIQFAYSGVVITLKDEGEVFTDEWLKQADFVRTKEYF